MRDKKDLHKLSKLSGDYLKYETNKVLTWCGNCGNYGIQNALKRALVLEGFKKEDFLMCFDIGCNGNGSDKIEGYTLHGLHGRVLPVASGCALANPKMKVIASAGDGGTFSEGITHLVCAIRNDYPVLFIHHNNENYGLTVGQASSLTRCGAIINGTPKEVTIDPINSLDFVLSLNPSFVARSFSGEIGHITEMFRLALKHKGFAYVEILQSCPTYNKMTPDIWYAERIKMIEDKKDYDKSDIWQARRIVQDMENEIWLGLLYENKKKSNFFETYPFRKGVKTALVEEVRHKDISQFMQ
ncbi:MAG: thiamine pyrophosphate-dependent enzyme [Candidatus Paceibacterota bacterium]